MKYNEDQNSGYNRMINFYIDEKGKDYYEQKFRAMN